MSEELKTQLPPPSETQGYIESDLDAPGTVFGRLARMLQDQYRVVGAYASYVVLSQEMYTQLISEINAHRRSVDQPRLVKLNEIFGMKVLLKEDTIVM